MNAYSLGLSGSWWLLLLLAAAGISLGIYTYRYTIPAISKPRKIVQIILRSIAITLLLFALFEPVFTMITGKIELPSISVVLDNSISCSLNDAQFDRKKEYLEGLERAKLNSIDDKQLRYLLFDSDVRAFASFKPDSIKFDGQMTDISKSMEYVTAHSEENNTQAVVLFTDGAYNSGKNPLNDVDFLGKPVYVVGIGDSTEPKDVSLESIITNEVAYIDNPVPVNVNVKINGYDRGQVKLSLYDNDQFISEQEINVTSSSQASSAIFQYNPKQEGIRKLTVTASSLDGELTLKNNRLSEFINVLKNKRIVAIFAGAPSPDVSFLTNALSKQKGIEIKKYIQKKESEFFDNAPTVSDLKEAEVIIFVGFPISSSPSAIVELIRKEVEQGKPLMFIASLNTDYNKLKVFEDYLPFITLSSKPQEFLALPDIKPDALSSPLLRVYGNEKDLKLWNDLPPIFRTETFVKAKPEAQTVSGLKVNNVPLKEPLIMTYSFQKIKSIAVLGYGLWRWKLLGYAPEVAEERTDAIDLYDIFVSNSYRWLSVSQENKNVRIKTSKKYYITSESVEFLGQIYDNSFNPIDNANVSVKVSGGSTERDLVLTSLGNGRYFGKIDGLTDGDYFFKGEATVSGNKLGSDNGRFSVGELSLEYLNLRMNSQLLRAIAERSGGKFYVPSQVGSLIEDIKSKSSFKDKALTVRSDFALWNLPWLLGISLTCFAAEWFMRKRYGMV
jgi:hypothetical protein